MGSLVGPSLVNSYLYFHEQIWLSNCPEDFKPPNYKQCCR